MCNWEHDAEASALGHGKKGSSGWGVRRSGGLGGVAGDEGSAIPVEGEVVGAGLDGGFVADDAEGTAVDGGEVAELVLVVHPDDAGVAVVAACADVAPETEGGPGADGVAGGDYGAVG